MKRSHYFHDLCASYSAELDDLRENSEGRDVLQARLRDKRRAFASLVPMMSFSPELVASAFHGAFSFPSNSRAALHELLQREPGDFLPWGEVSGAVQIADWAQPMISLVLAEAEGEDFLSTVLGLEFALTTERRGAGPRADADGDDDTRDDDADDERDHERDGEDNGSDDESSDETEGMGEDFLEQQGFDRRTPS
jgi:hypothetical protein